MVDEHPLVSVIVPTFNNQLTIAACLESIRSQSYENLEVIVVDNFSTDLTFAIASRYQEKVTLHGDERSEQANFGVGMATGEYVLRMDADLVLDPSVVEECVKVALGGFDAVEVHNSPDPEISWIARARRFEYDLLRGDARRISARFVKRELYLAVGGLDPSLIAGEDYDFQNRLDRHGAKVGYIQAQSISISEPTSIVRMARKHFRYGRQSVQFHTAADKTKSGQLDGNSILQKLYFRKWREYVREPVSASLFVAYFVIKVAAGGSGYVYESLIRKAS
jgi:glycosyltransferase involved in cell wall biosynthesis